MSKVLESLVARGRRTKNFREQREITFGLADLATRTDIHERLVRKGGVITLVDILSTSQDAEAQQFAAIAIANTSSSTQLCTEILKLEGVIARLIQYVGNESADSIGRQYCAMALGNLLAEPATHETIFSLGVTAALVTMLKNCTDGRELKSGRHTAFALSNLASNLAHHKQIVEQGAIELLIALACCEDPDTQRQAISALRGLCLTPDNRISVVQKGILDPLILVSTSDDIDTVREVASALNCLSSEYQNKEEISYRAISTLIHLMLLGDTDVERHASSAIANLMELTEIHPRFVEEKGMAPLISLCSSSDLSCRVEASRAIANLSSNPDLIEALIKENALPPLVKCIDVDGDKAQYSALAVANFATNSRCLFEIVQAGALPGLVTMVSRTENMNCRRYSALAIANITACETFHSSIMAAGAPEALFTVTNFSDAAANQFVACAIANLSSNICNHEPIVELGGLQPIIALVHDPDPNIHKQAAAALRGFSATGDTKMKIVQEGGLEPLCLLLQSTEDLVLRESTACLCNLSLGDENKFEVVKCGAVEPLINLMESEDPIVACHACECLANLAEMTENQEIIVKNGAVSPCINAMRSRHIEIQRESGRLIANLSASETTLAADTIVQENGHLVLVSFLLSQDTACQRAGSFGIGNLCTHDHHRVTLVKAGAIEPLTSLTRSETTASEIRRFAMLAIANLAASFRTHDEFVSHGTIPMLISFFNADDTELRNYASYAVAQLSKNSDMMEIITSEGGLEPVLYLGRSTDKLVQREVLPALTALSFMDCNKVPICTNGSLPPIIEFINVARNNPEESQLACCSVANLIEASQNLKQSLNHGCAPLLVEALASDSDSVQREAARAIGNMVVNIDYSDEVLKHTAILPHLVACFSSRNVECQRMAAFAISNVSSNLKSHDELLKHGILGLIENECQASLDPKRFSDHETVRFCLLILANLTSDKQNHESMGRFFGKRYQFLYYSVQCTAPDLISYIMTYLLDLFMDFTRHRDAICRQHAILALGNLCAEYNNMKKLVNIKCMDALIAFSFPSPTDGSINAQFQAIAGLHGLSKHAHLREAIILAGGLEPLILGARGNKAHSDIEIQREATSIISNLALEEKNRLTIAKSGALPALVALTKTSDTICIIHAVTAFANLAETSNEIHYLLISAQLMDPMSELAKSYSTHVDIKRSASRCFALFASNECVHSSLLVPEVTSAINALASQSKDSVCERFAALAVSNLALVEANHSIILKAKLLESVISLVHSQDIETLRGSAYALHSFSNNEENHSALEACASIESLLPLLQSGDRDTAFQACLAVKYLSKCHQCRIKFVKCHGLEPLLELSTVDHLETKRELAASLRNISLSNETKVEIMKSGIDYITTLCRDSDSEVSWQACGVIANISEKQENKVLMVENGIVHHLQAAMSFSKDVQILRESVRSFASLSSAIENISALISSGVLGSLVHALSANDILCRRFAAMAISNLAINTEMHFRIIHEVGMPSLMLAARQGDRDFIDITTQRHAVASLANLASCNDSHNELIDHGCAELTIELVKSSDLDIRRNALLSLANLASNKANHRVLEKCYKLNDLIKNNIKCHDPTVQLHSVSCLRGLSTDASMRKHMISAGGTETLLSLVHTNDSVLKIEVLSTLCNMSLGGCIGDHANTVLENIDMSSLICFLCNGESATQRIFGAMALGNIASDVNLQAPIFDSGALKPLIGLSDKNTEQDKESQRCMAYAICNLSAEIPNRMSIITQGGLASIMYLCRTGDISDMLAALSTLRGLTASPDARRLIFEESVLHVLVLGFKSGNLQCKREVASILANLSLNEENKFDIARSPEAKELMSLLDETDVDCICNTCRAIANICEVNELHADGLGLLTLERLVRLSSPAAGIYINRESARCIVNLSNNFKMHENLVMDPQLMDNLSALCSIMMSDARTEEVINVNADTTRLVILALANMSMNVQTQKSLDIDNLLLVCVTALSRDISYEAKCSACMAIGALCTDHETALVLIEAGTIPTLLKLIKTHTHDMSVYATFVLNKLAMVHSTHQEFSRELLSSDLTENLSMSNRHCVTYSVTALRRLSDDINMRPQLISSGALDFLSKAYDENEIERSREIACCVCHLALWSEAKLHIAKTSMLKHIVVLCNSSDVETSRFALGSVANVSEDIQSHQMILQHSSIIQQMLRLTQDRHVSRVREATRVLANIVSSISTHIPLLKGGGMAIISGVSKTQDFECVHNVAVIFRKLAANSAVHEIFFTDESINAVIDLVANRNTQTVLQSAAALRDISSNPEFQLAFVESGAMQAAVELAVSDSDIEAKIVALGVIRHISMSMSLKTRIMRSGVANIISRCIETSDDCDLLYQCVSSIANIAEHAQNKDLLVQMGILSSLVSLCNCPSAKVKQETARAFCLLSSATENADAFDHRVLPAVISLQLNCLHEETGRDAASTICNVAISNGKKLLIGKCHGIEALIELLDSPYSTCQLHSCKALSRLTNVTENQNAMYLNGGSNILLRICQQSSEIDLILSSLMVLVNLSSCTEHQVELIQQGALGVLKQFISSDNSLLRQYSVMTICNLSSHNSTLDHVARQIDLLLLIDLMHDDHRDTRSYAAMSICNLVSQHHHVAAILMAGGLTQLAGILSFPKEQAGVQLERAALLAIYNISTYENSHTLLAKKEVIQSIISFCKSPDILSRRFALLTLSNVACNDKTRASATKSGGLQAAVSGLKDEDIPTARFACICLSNMANESNTQSQILVHGGLPSLVSMSAEGSASSECALMCLSNLAANESNHLPLMKQSVFKRFIDATSTLKQNKACQFGIVNLTSNPEILSQIGRRGGIRPILALAKSHDLHSQCIAISGVRRLALIRENRDRLIAEGVISILAKHSCKAEVPELQQEIASCFCNLTLNPNHRIDMAVTAISVLSMLSMSQNPETMRLSLGAIANLSEDTATHPYMKQANVVGSAICSLGHQDLNIRREAARVIANLLSSEEFHPEIIEHGIDNLISLSAEPCDECRYLTAISFRKLSPSKQSHSVLIDNGLENILALTKVSDKMTKKHATTSIRDLSASNERHNYDKSIFYNLEAVTAMVELVKENEKELQIIAVSTLRHLSSSKRITDNFSRSVMVKCVARCISWANDDMKCQIAGLMANLSEHWECHSTMIAQGVIPVLVKLSTTENSEVKQVRRYE